MYHRKQVESSPLQYTATYLQIHAVNYCALLLFNVSQVSYPNTVCL